MKKIAAFIVKYRIVFTIIFAALMIFSAISMNWVTVEDEIVEFLPDDAESKICLDIMGKEFVTYSTADIYLEEISINETNDLCKKLEAVKNVSKVEFDVAQNYKDKSAYICVTFNAQAGDETGKAALNDVKTVLKDYKAYVNSDAGESISDMISSQMGLVIILVSIVVVAVLLLTTETFGEVLVLLLTFIAAAIINKGTNFLLGRISMISNSIAIVLQLALSVDYAIIFCNRYKEEREKADKQEAVITALAASIPAILASSLTTIAGLFAMTLMQFGLGADLGFVLIKAILLSLLSVFLFMPGLLIYFDKLIQKTKHKRLIPKVPFIGKFAYATRFIMPIIFVLLLVGGYICHNQVNYAYDSLYAPAINEAEGDYALEKIEENFGANKFALIIPAGNYENEKQLINDLSACKETKSVLGLANIDAINGYKLGDQVNYEEFGSMAGLDAQAAQALFAYYIADQGDHRDIGNFADYKAPIIDLFMFIHDKCLNSDMGIELEQSKIDMINSLYTKLDDGKKQLQGNNYSRIIVRVNLPIQGDETNAFMDKVHTIAEKYYPDNAKIAGDSMVAYDFNRSFSQDNITVLALSIIFVMIILFFTFKAVAMPILLILVIQGSIWINFGIAALQGNYVFFVCYLIVSAIQMGANIDYAIVISSRYLEFRETTDKRSAIIEAMNLAFPTIITSGSMMIIAGMLIGLLISVGSVSGIGYYLSIGTMITLCLVLFVLPQVLVLGDTIIQKTTVKFFGRFRSEKAGNIIRRIISIALAVVSIAVLVLLPFFNKNQTAGSLQLKQECEQQLEKIAELDQMNEAYKAKNGTYAQAKYNFAEEYVTENIGRKQLVSGQNEYDQNQALLIAGEAEYAAGNEEYAAGLAEYQAGKETYDNGLATYNAAKSVYDGFVSEYDAALADYNKADEQAKALSAQYETCLKLEAEYEKTGDPKTLEALYEALGDYSSTAEMKDDVDANELALYIAKQGLDTIKSLLDTAKSRLDASEAELEAGAAQLREAEAKLAQAQEQLADAKTKIEKGKVELAAARKKLDEGYQLLDTNAIKLEGSLAELDQYNTDEEKLDAGTKILMEVPEIKAKVSDKATYADICTAAKTYYSDILEEIENNRTEVLALSVILIFGAICALLSAICWLFDKLFIPGFVPGKILSVIAAVCGIIGCILWVQNFSGYIILAIAAGLMVLFALLGFGLIKKCTPKQAEAPINA